MSKLVFNLEEGAPVGNKTVILSNTWGDRTVQSAVELLSKSRFLFYCVDVMCKTLDKCVVKLAEIS